MEFLLLTGGTWKRREDLIRAALLPRGIGQWREYPCPAHYRYPNGIWLFSNGLWQSEMLFWMKRAEPENVVSCDLSFANDTFLRTLTEFGYRVALALLDTEDARAPDNERIGWSRALAGRWCLDRTLWFPGTLPEAAIVARLRSHPAVAAIRRETNGTRVGPAPGSV